MRRAVSVSVDEWRERRCVVCNHEWQKRIDDRWVCARCSYRPVTLTQPQPKQPFVTRRRLLNWIESESTRRTGSGSYAKGQRVILRMLWDRIMKAESN